MIFRNSHFNLFCLYLMPCIACKILAPRPRIEAMPPHQECRVLTTEPPGKYLFAFLNERRKIQKLCSLPKLWLFWYTHFYCSCFSWVTCFKLCDEHTLSKDDVSRQKRFWWLWNLDPGGNMKPYNLKQFTYLLLHASVFYCIKSL